MANRILVTGHKGYIGSVLTTRLIEAGYAVTGLDTGFFADCTLVPGPPVEHEIFKDIRDSSPWDLEGFDALVHLAALSNDPLGDLNSAWTDDINHQASVLLAKHARQAGVGRFLFSSSCIMYGAANLTGEVAEDSALDPKTAYARSKVLAEQAISQLACPGFSPVFLRNGTIYGLSPRMRFDTVVNSLVGSAITTGRVTIYGDGKPWRPVVHIEDAASAILTALQAPLERIHNQALNIGAPSLNHQILKLAEITASTVPGCELECLARPDADQRTYKTSFDKIARLLSEFQPRWNACDGIRLLYEQFRDLPLSHAQFTDARFTRLRWLRHLLGSGHLEKNLRWAEVLTQ